MRSPRVYSQVASQAAVALLMLPSTFLENPEGLSPDSEKRILHLCVSNLQQWLDDGTTAYRSANNVSCYEGVPLFIEYVFDTVTRREVWSDDPDDSLIQRCLNDRLGVNFAGLIVDCVGHEF